MTRQANDAVADISMATIWKKRRGRSYLSNETLKQSALRRCRQRIRNLLGARSYIRLLWKQFLEAIGARTDLDMNQKEQAPAFIEQLINETAAA